MGERAGASPATSSVSRNTVAHYRRWASHARAADRGPCPSRRRWPRCCAGAARERPAQEQSLVEPFREQVLAWHAQGVEGQAIWQLLVEQHGFAGSYSSIKRFLRRVAPPTPRATLRLEVDPGDEAQVDFGFGGLFRDPEHDRLRRAWVFVMTLSCSRHQYAELVFDQSVATWLRLHRAAFEFFGGVPRRVVLDNLRAAIVHAALYDPEVQRSYREFAEHYGFLIAPCRPRTPEHKGKVEQGGVHYVKRNALAGRAFRDLHDGNRHLLPLVCRDRRPPRPRHDQADPAGGLRPGRARAPCSRCRSRPGSWPSGSRPSSTPTAMSSSPAPTTRRPTASSASGSGSAPPTVKVELYHEYALVATHRRARPGQRRTLIGPPAAGQGPLPHADPGLVSHPRGRDRARLWRRSSSALLGDRPLDRLRSAQGVLRFGQRYGATAPGRRLRPRPRRRRVSLPHRQDDPGPRARSASPLPSLTPVARRGPDAAAAPRPPLDHLLPRPRCGRGAVPMELTHQLTPMLRTLRLSGILETLEVRNRQAVEQQTSFVEFLTVLLQDEVERRAQSKLRLRLRRAAFDPTKTLEGFDFSFNPKLNKAQVFDLATCQFIERHENVLIYGPTGVGKSHLGQALAHEACRRGFDVLFIDTAKMLTHLAGGRADGTHEQRLARYTRPDLLVLDDFGLKPLRAPGARGPLRRHQRAV